MPIHGYEGDPWKQNFICISAITTNKCIANIEHNFVHSPDDIFLKFDNKEFEFWNGGKGAGRNF